MKKVLLAVVLVFMVTVAAMAIANGIEQKGKLDYYESSMKATAKYTGMGYLGYVNVSEISRKNGYSYDGPAIVAELLRRAELDGHYDTWTSIVGDHDDIYICKLTVYEDGQENVPTFQKKVLAEYLYGEIF